MHCGIVFKLIQAAAAAAAAAAATATATFLKSFPVPYITRVTD
jgi:hypothetical protein